MLGLACKLTDVFVSKRSFIICTHPPDIIRQIKSRRIRWAGHVVERKVCKVLVVKPEGKRPLGRPRCRWEDGIRMDLREIGRSVWIGFDWLRIWTGGELL
jgi:hypothetical protein